jgi:hypothetical protein
MSKFLNVDILCIKNGWSGYEITYFYTLNQIDNFLIKDI